MKTTLMAIVALGMMSFTATGCMQKDGDEYMVTTKDGEPQRTSCRCHSRLTPKPVVDATTKDAKVFRMAQTSVFYII